MADELEVRLQKLEAFKADGVDPYPKVSHRDAMVGEVISSFEALLASQEKKTLAGRVLITRVHGAMMFADLMDESGRIQLMFKEDETKGFAAFRDRIDPGDIVEVTGAALLTKRGQQSLLVSSWNILAKALLPLPEKWHGLQDVETRYRERELDLISNEDVRRRFVVRTKLISAMRRFLDDRGFLEVETPILQPIPGGANARPFVTHHNALDIDLYLRIAPEIYLKRLVIGGFEKVYEIGRSFRNEGIDYAHNPEFTLIELYWSYVGKEAFVAFLEELIRVVIQQSVGSLDVPYQNGTISFADTWKRTTFREAIQEACGIDIDTYKDPAGLVKAVQQKGLQIDFSGCVGIGEHYDQLFKKTARAAFTQPVWVFDYPVELKPLANRHPDDPTKSASVQLVVHGAEIINAYYHELNDPIDQRERFMQQESMREQGSEEAQHIDESYLRALEHGMPPTSGMGIGLDRLVAFLTDAPNLKEVILFPTLRPEAPLRPDAPTP
jgi:lysyl-tRNA synthetase class 2